MPLLAEARLAKGCDSLHPTHLLNRIEGYMGVPLVHVLSHPLGQLHISSRTNFSQAPMGSMYPPQPRFGYLWGRLRDRGSAKNVQLETWASKVGQLLAHLQGFTQRPP